MRILSPFLHLRFLFSCIGLPYSMDKKSQVLIFFGIKSIEKIFYANQGCDKLRHLVTVLVSITFHVTAKFFFHGSYSTLSKCNPSLTHCAVILYSFSFAKNFKVSNKRYSTVHPFFASIPFRNHS